jgi:hypothetical protein
MIFIKMAAGAIVGALYFFAISGWGRNGMPWFRARRAAAWWGLIAAELLMLVVGYPASAQFDLVTRVFADLMFGFSAWLMLGLPSSILFGLATYIVVRARRPSSPAPKAVEPSHSA